MSEAPILSVVAPCYNEQGNLIPLVTAIRAALEPLKIPYEVVIADDFSRDDSWKILQKLGAEDNRIRAVRLNRNCGQSAAVWAGIQATTPRSTPICKIIRANCRVSLKPFSAVTAIASVARASRLARKAIHGSDKFLPRLPTAFATESRTRPSAILRAATASSSASVPRG